MNRTLIIFLSFAGSCCAQLIQTNWETGVILYPVKDAATHNMIRASMREKDPLLRIQALVALQTIRDPADEPLIREMQQDPVAAVREQALAKPPGACAPTVTPPTTPDQIRQDLNNPNVLKQQLAVDAVAKLKLTTAATNLVPLLESPDSVLRRHVCEALGALRVEQSAALAKQLGRDEDPFVRRAAAEALLAIHSDPARDALVKLLQHEHAPVRTESARALGDWKQRAVAPALHPLLLDKDTLPARAAAEALGKLGNPDSRPPLLEAIVNRADYAQDRFAWALGELHAEEAVPVLLTLLTGPNGATQTSAAEALGKIGDPQAVPALRKVLVAMKAHGPDTRQRAIEALRRLGDRESVKRVMQIITERVVPPPPGSTEPSYDMDDTRAEGLRYLEFLGEVPLVDQMLEKLTDMPSYQLRKVIAELMTKLKGTPYMAALTIDCRHYLLESLDGEFFPKGPPMPGVVPVP